MPEADEVLVRTTAHLSDLLSPLTAHCSTYEPLYTATTTFSSTYRKGRAATLPTLSATSLGRG